MASKSRSVEHLIMVSYNNHLPHLFFTQLNAPETILKLIEAGSERSSTAYF